MTAMLGCDRADRRAPAAPDLLESLLTTADYGSAAPSPPPTPAPAQLTIPSTNSSASTSGFYWYRSRQPLRRNSDIHLSVGPQFTSCYDADATQEIFDTDVCPLVDVAWSGITVSLTIFAYGVTSSGKTHTMQGPPDDPGVILRVVELGGSVPASYLGTPAAQAPLVHHSPHEPVTCCWSGDRISVLLIVVRNDLVRPFVADKGDATVLNTDATCGYGLLPTAHYGLWTRKSGHGPQYKYITSHTSRKQPDFYEGLGKHQEKRIAPLIPAARSPYQEPQLFGLEAEIDTYSDAKITCTTLICQVLSKWYKYSWRQCSLPSPTKARPTKDQRQRTHILAKTSGSAGYGHFGVDDSMDKRFIVTYPLGREFSLLK
ncbi:hypothetical protein B0H14DRAFT_2592289 [Mycena olivaceomarginata]|nr:hypothetical protein B0H14DRAFT_2592289 [Mycena olivaceomarginata]